MSSLRSIAPAVAGAVTGGVVALIVASGGSGSSRTVTVVDTNSNASGPAASAAIPASVGKTGGLSVNKIYKRDSPGVVDITVLQGGQQQSPTGNSGLFGPMPMPSPGPTEGEGAGVVYNTRGDIVTDQHVVAHASTVKVHFSNGVTARAKVVGQDASTDIAVLHVNVPQSELHPIPFANSSAAQVGDPVVAIGSPFSYPETATQGIVSATGRSIEAPNKWTIAGAIQTDAAINPGNSGGPLLDATGRVLGLNDQIQTSSGQSAGIGFATPGNTDVKVANQIISGKPVRHAYVGLCLNPTSDGGAQVARRGSPSCAAPVVAGGPAARAGLQPGDLITAVDGKRVNSTGKFIGIIAQDEPGQTVTLTVKRGSGSKQIQLKLGNRPAVAPSGG